MIKGKATVNIFKTNSGEGARMVIPKLIVEELKMKNKEIFTQKLVDGHIEMERTTTKEDNTVSISQFKTRIGEKTNTVTRVYILQDIVEALNIENKDIMLFKLIGEKIIIQKF